MTPDYLREEKGEIRLRVRVQPRASRSEVGEVVEGELRVRIAAPPVEDAANEELVRFLARRLECSRGQVRLVRGATSRHKVVAVQGLGLGQVRAALEGPGMAR